VVLERLRCEPYDGEPAVARLTDYLFLTAAVELVDLDHVRSFATRRRRVALSRASCAARYLFAQGVRPGGWDSSVDESLVDARR
jgi:hypothetical protein